MFCTSTLALSAVCVQCPVWLFFCSTLVSDFPFMFLRYCLSGFEMLPVAPVIAGVTCFRIPHALLFHCKVFIIIIIIIIISFMQGIYTYIPEKIYVAREYSVAAILLLLFMVLISLVSVLNLLYFYVSIFRSMCAVPNMAVFCSSLTSWFPGALLTYFYHHQHQYLQTAHITT